MLGGYSPSTNEGPGYKEFGKQCFFIRDFIVTINF